jgi:arylsulfatase A-like enzyme
MRVLFLDLDTLRPDHLGCYGYHRDTSPNLDRIAAMGVRFDRYYTSDAPCLPSRAALLTGRHGIHTGAVGHGGTAADLRLAGPSRQFCDIATDMHSLFAIFNWAGFHTASISPFAQRHSSWWFTAGLNELHNPARKRGNESAEEVTPTVMKWLDEHAADDNWFLHVNYWDAHTPYRAPAEFGNPFENEPLPPWPDAEAVAAHQLVAGPHSAREVMMYDDVPPPRWPRMLGAVRNMDDMRKLIDGYDCGIAYMDSHIGQILDYLAQKGLLDDTAIFVTSDHGENFGELGVYAEHATADHATCRIPMLVKLPGGKQGHVASGFHSCVDLVPTVAEWLGRPAYAHWDGKSFLSCITEGADVGRDYVVLSQCAHSLQRSVRWGDWLYMRSYHDGYRLFPYEMLFNIADDPYERFDLAEQRPDKIAEGARRLSLWHDDMMRTQLNGAPDPLWTVYNEGGPQHTRGRLKDYCARLRSTGRAEAADALAAKYPNEL